MVEQVKLKEFDILGLITLHDVQGIEKFVTPVVVNGEVTDYLSRSKEYYNVKSMTELALEREELAMKLTRDLSKRNFVIIENMLNCSGKVYFKKFEQYIENGKNEQEALQLAQAEECMMEDIRNMLVIFQGKGLIQVNPVKRLPGGSENAQKRAIEMDNKALLFIFCQALKMKKAPEEIEVLTPGYGSIYIGPFLKAMYGYDFTNTLKSKYIEATKNSQETPIRALMSSERPFEEGKTILLLDDNIGTGQTMDELKRSLQQEGIRNTISGAIQYNWRNYYRVSVGEKTGIARPDVSQFDILTPLNYAGHKLYKHAIDLLHSSGNEYIKYLQSKSYRRDEYCDITGALIRGVTCASTLGIQLSEDVDKYIVPKKEKKEILPEYQEIPRNITNPISQEIIKRIVHEVGKIEEPEQIPPENNGDGSR